MKRITKGLDVPISNEPEQKIHDGPRLRTVGIVAADYIGMKPTMDVQEGEIVKRGQVLFSDKKTVGVRFTAPVSGRVAAINRAEKRRFLSVVLEADGDDEITFSARGTGNLTTLGRDAVVATLQASGLWTALRTRPYSRVPSVETSPRSIFVTAIDTNPLAAKPEVVINNRDDDFRAGLQVLTCLTDGPVFVAKQPGCAFPGGDVPRVRMEDFEGPHPAGLPGTHIHMLDPVSEKKTVWYLNYQDVIAIGHLFVTGRYDATRVISLAGPGVTRPRLVRTTLGASLSELTAGSLIEGDLRVISGSVLSGRAMADPKTAFLGRYHNQVSVLAEGRDREFLGWQKPGFDRFSIRRVFASALKGGGQSFAMTTSTHGSHRAMVPIGVFEDVMPLDILPTFLLRALLCGDTEQAAALGALELDEEDLALCTFVCPGKTEYGPILRQSLTTIERDG